MYTPDVMRPLTGGTLKFSLFSRPPEVINCHSNPINSSTTLSYNVLSQRILLQVEHLTFMIFLWCHKTYKMGSQWIFRNTTNDPLASLLSVGSLLSLLPAPGIFGVNTNIISSTCPPITPVKASSVIQSCVFGFLPLAGFMSPQAAPPHRTHI